MTRINVMADIETWGKKPGFDLRSIGATLFDPITGIVGKPCPSCNSGTLHDCSDCLNTRTDATAEFYIATDNPVLSDREMMAYRIHFNDPTLIDYKYPLQRDPETVAWWNDQSAEAQEAFANPVELRIALIQFADWLRGSAGDMYDSNDRDRRIPDDVNLWSHGPAFDPPILAAAYDACGLPVPWHYRAPRDTRTAFDMANVGDHSMFMQQFNHGTAHNALDDAISQARCVCEAYRRVRVSHDVATHWRAD